MTRTAATATAIYHHEFKVAPGLDCRFTLGDWEFDLCSIFQSPGQNIIHDRTNKASNGLTTYRFNLNGSIDDQEIDGQNVSMYDLCIACILWSNLYGYAV